MKDYQQLLILFLLCICTFFVNIISSFPDLMEVRNFISAREMIQEGHWWSTTMNLEPRLEKPPLPTWLTAISAMAFGGLDNLFALKLPAALSATLMVFFFYSFCRELSKEKYLPFLGGIIMATSLLIVQQARTNSWDIYTHVFMMGSLWQLTRAVKRNTFINVVYSAFWMGLSIMSKGPVSLYALWIPFIIAFGIGDGFITWKKHWKWLLFILICGLFLGFGWNLANYFEQPIITEYVLQKETTSWTERHVRPFYFYLHFPIYIGIWLVFIVASFFYKYAAPRVNNWGNYKFSIFWILISIFLLSIIPTKKERYLLPAIIPMCLMATYLLYDIIKRFKLNKASKVDHLVMGIFSILISIGAVLIPFLVLYLDVDASSFVTIVAFGIGILGGIGFVLWKKRKIVYIVGNVTLICALFCIGLIPITAEKFYNNPDFKSLAEIQKFSEFDNLQYYTQFDKTDPRLVWLAGKPTQPLSNINFNSAPKERFVAITINSINEVIPKEFLLKYEVINYGSYDLRRKKVSWKANVNLLQLRN